MKRNITIICLSILILSVVPACRNMNKENQSTLSADVVVYGGTSAGLAAAIQASRMDKSVIVLEPGNRVGGLTTGGLGQTDIGNKQAIGGISREFYQKMKEYYNDQDHWKWQKESEYMDGGQTRTGEQEDAMWTFEPSAAIEVYHDMLEKENIDVRYNLRLEREQVFTFSAKEMI